MCFLIISNFKLPGSNGYSLFINKSYTGPAAVVPCWPTIAHAHTCRHLKNKLYKIRHLFFTQGDDKDNYKIYLFCRA